MSDSGAWRTARGAWPFVALSAVVFATYWPCLGYGFLGIDDTVLIVDNQRFLSDPANILRSFVRATWEVPLLADPGLYYRPLLILSLMLDYQWAGADPFVFHLSELAYHAVASCLVFAYLRRVWTSEAFALFLAAAFAAHPAFVSVGAWVTARDHSLMTIGLLIAMLNLSAYLREPRWKSCLLHFLGLAIALFSRETAVVACGLAALYVVLCRRGPRPWTPFRVLLPGWLVIVTGWLWLRAAALAQQAWSLRELATAAADNAPVLLHGVGKLLIPCYLALMPTVADTPDIIGIVALAFIGLALLRSPGRSWSAAAFGGAWFLLPLVPTLGTRDFVGHEARLHGPSVGLLIILSQLDVARRWRWTTVTITMAIVVVGALGASTRVHARAFRDWRSYWEAAVAAAPHSAIAHAHLGELHVRDGRLSEAERELFTALALNPRQPMVNNNIGALYWHLGNPELAAYYFRQEIEVNPKYPDAYFNMGALLVNTGDPRAALSWFEATLALNPRHLGALEQVATLAAAAGDPAAAQAYRARAADVRRATTPPQAGELP